MFHFRVKHNTGVCNNRDADREREREREREWST